jgi:hypothetical protein
MLAWAQQCAPEELWKRALLLLLRGGGVAPAPVPADGPKRTLFGEVAGSDEEAAAVVLTAARRCCERNSPFALWAAAKTCPNKRLASLVVKASAQSIALLPAVWQTLFTEKSIASTSATVSDPPLELFTPTKRIVLAGATGGEAAVRLNGSRVSNNRERLRDVLSVLFLEPQSARLKCNDLLQMLDAENEAWFCECFADVYSRYCNKVADQERCMIEKRASVAAPEDTELVLVRVCCETLFEKHLGLWQQMCLTLVHKIEALRSETDQPLSLIALETSNLARLLSIISFLGVRSGSAHLAHFGVAHSLFESAREADAEGDSRQLVLLLIAIGQFLELAPPWLSLARAGRAAVPLVQRLRAATSRLNCFADLFIFVKCNNVLAALRCGPGDLADSSSGMDDFASLSQQLSHPVVIRNLLLSHVNVETSAAPTAASSPVSVSPAPFSSNQETKYWFFRMQNALLKLVNVVAHSVAQNAVFSAMAEVPQLLRERGHVEAEEEAYFHLASVRCEMIVKKECAELLPRLAPSSIDAPVLRRAIDYACEAALQQCYDALTDAVKEYFKSIRPRQSVSAPAGLALPEKRYVSTVLQSPFVKRPNVQRQSRRHFAEMAGLTVALAGLDEPCDDWTEFFCFLILVAKFEQWELLSALTAEQRLVLEECVKECKV